MKIGDKIFWCTALESPSEIREGTITKMSPKTSPGQLVWVDNAHRPEDCIFADYCWPIAAKEEMRKILTKRAELKRAFEESMGLIYQLRNKIIRGEL